MANLNGFDASQVEPSKGFEPIPAGKYLASISASESKVNKESAGSHLLLTFVVLEGEFAGRNVWARLNLDNPNPTAVKIARADLSAICRAVGVMKPRDSVDLHNLPLFITVKCKKNDKSGDWTNEIGKYEPKSAAQPVPSAPPPQAQTTQQPQQPATAGAGAASSTATAQGAGNGGNSTAPWKKQT